MHSSRRTKAGTGRAILARLREEGGVFGEMGDREGRGGEGGASGETGGGGERLHPRNRIKRKRTKPRNQREAGRE